MGCPVYSNQSQLPTVHCSTKKFSAVSPLCPNSYIVSTVKLYFTILLLSFKDRVLPTIIFPIFTALAFKLLFGRIAAAGLTEQLGTHCRTTPEFTPQIFTGVPAIDQTLCPLVTFFNTLMHDDTGMSFLTYAIGTGGPLVLIPTFEAYRPGQSFLLAYPVIWLLISQLMSIAATLPLYWLAFILMGGARKARNVDSKLVTQAESESLVFGIIMGVVVPSVAMLILDDPIVTAMWQFYPAFVAIAESVHLFFRTSANHPQSGHVTLRVLFIACFLISSSVHISTVWPLFSDLENLKALLLPSIHLLDSKVDIAVHLLDFLKWDMLLGFSSTAVATLWFTSSAKQLFAIIAWYAFAIPAFGFGAAITGVAVWRNSFV